MNAKKAVVVIGLTLFLSVACFPVVDTFSEPTVTPPANGWTNKIEVQRKEQFWVKNGDDTKRVSIAGLTPLSDASKNDPCKCTIVPESMGNSFNLTNCTPATTYTIEAGEGLFVAK